MKKIVYVLFLMSLSSHATIWTINSFEMECSKLEAKGPKKNDFVYGSFTRSPLDASGEMTATCFLGDNEISSATFGKLNQMNGYSIFRRKGSALLRHEIYNAKGLFDNQEIYIQKGDDSKSIYFRLNSKGKVIDGHYMIPPEMIKIIPMGDNAQIAIDNGKQISLDQAQEKIKGLLSKGFTKELKGLDSKKQNFSELILELNRRQLSGNQDVTNNTSFSPAAAK